MSCVRECRLLRHYSLVCVDTGDQGWSVITFINSYKRVMSHFLTLTNAYESWHPYQCIQRWVMSHLPTLTNTYEWVMPPLSMHTKVSHVNVDNAYKSESCHSYECIQKWVMSHLPTLNERVVSLLATHTNGSRHTDKHTRTRHVTPAYTLSLFLVLSLHPPLPLSLLRSLFFLWDTHTQTHT